MIGRDPKSSEDFGPISLQEIGTVQKACAVALHPEGAPARVIAFTHPLAGMQLVKGTINAGEPPLKAAARELWEETGLTVKAGLNLGQSETIAAGEIWHFALLRPAPTVLKTWKHAAPDDGGQIFDCFWQDLDAPHRFEGRFARAWDFIRERLAP